MSRRHTHYALAIILLLSIALITSAYQSYSAAIDAATKRTATGTIAHTRCGDIEYATLGEGKPVLVVHGAGGGYDQGLDIGDDIVSRGFRVIAMSRFGYLHTPLPTDASAAAQADAHACLLDALHVDRVAVIGVSAGAPSAMQFALRHADRTNALVLLVPAAYVPRADGSVSLKTPPGTNALFNSALKWDFAFWLGPKISRNLFIRSILATPPETVKAASLEEQGRVHTVIEHILPVGARRLGLLNDATVVRSLSRYALEDIRAPTLAISTADDLYGTYDAAHYTAEHIPHAKFVGYDTGGHLWVGRHNEVAAEVTRFLEM